MGYYERMMKKDLKESPVILAVESSCDETAAAIVKGGRELLANQIISSATEHVKYGGVVPEIASRMHTDAIDKVVKMALDEASLTLKDVDAVACTYGAGLLGALLVGVSYVKALAFSLDVPLIPVSHIRGHLSASYLSDKNLKPPFISLLGSGGHTAIICVNDYSDFEIVGSTLDDAVGEAFDKVARVLGLAYPGGPNIERLAKEGQPVVELPKMLKGKGGYSFSYSGLKTAVINYVHKMEMSGKPYSKADVACSFQRSAIDVLVEKTVEACKEKNLNTVTAGGGVVANGYLREQLKIACEKNGVKLVLPEKKMCTDNAAMIGVEAYVRYLNRDFADLNLNAKASVGLNVTKADL